jgi:hypothetical protein
MREESAVRSITAMLCVLGVSLAGCGEKNAQKAATTDIANVSTEGTAFGLPKGPPLKKTTYPIAGYKVFCSDVPVKVSSATEDGLIVKRREFDCQGNFDILLPVADFNGKSDVPVARATRLSAVFVEKYQGANNLSYAGFSQQTDVLKDFSGTGFKWIIVPFDDSGKPIETFEAPVTPIACSGTDPDQVENTISTNSRRYERVEQIRLIAVRAGSDPKACKRLAPGTQCKFDWQCSGDGCYPGPGNGTPRYCLGSGKHCAWPGSPGDMMTGNGFEPVRNFNGKEVSCGNPNPEDPKTRLRWFYDN